MSGREHFYSNCSNSTDITNKSGLTCVVKHRVKMSTPNWTIVILDIFFRRSFAIIWPNAGVCHKDAASLQCGRSVRRRVLYRQRIRDVVSCGQRASQRSGKSHRNTMLPRRGGVVKLSGHDLLLHFWRSIYIYIYIWATLLRMLSKLTLSYLSLHFKEALENSLTSSPCLLVYPSMFSLVSLIYSNSQSQHHVNMKG